MMVFIMSERLLASEIQSGHEFDIALTLNRLLNPLETQLSLEEKTQLVVDLDAWLIGAKEGTPKLEGLHERQRFVEKNWIKQERKQMQERGTHGEEKVLTPKQEKLIRELEVELRERVGAGVLLSGPAGTGKSYFLELLAERLAYRSNGVDVITAQPMTTSLDMVGTTRTNPRELFASKITNQLREIYNQRSESDTKTELLRQLLETVMDIEVAPYAINPEQRRKAEINFFTMMGLSEGVSLVDATTFNQYVNQNGGLEQILLNLTDFWQKVELHHKLRGMENIDPGPLYEAGEKGFILIINEADKMAMNGLSKFGWGLEGFLQTQAGKTERTAQGVSTTIDKGFLVLASVNDLSKIPDNIQRRFIQKRFDSNSEDLIWQARVLLADEEGESLLRERPQDEHDLCRFLLWWEALGRNKNIAFNTNVLTQMCTKLKAGLTFAAALNGVIASLGREFQPFFDRYANKGTKPLSYDDLIYEVEASEIPDDNFDLASLNWRANARYLGGETVEEVNALVDTQKLIEGTRNHVYTPSVVTLQNGELILGVGAVANKATGSIDITPSIIYDLEADLHLDPKQLTQVMASSPQASTITLKHGNSIEVIDTPTGERMKIFDHTVAPNKGVYEKLPQVDNQSLNLLKAYWIDETHGVMVIAKGQDQVEVVYIEKQFNDTEDDEVAVPQVHIRRRVKCKLSGNVQDISIMAGDDALVLTNSTSNEQVMIEVRANSHTESLKRKRVANDAPVTNVIQGHFGTFVVKGDQVPTVQWLRSTS